MSQLTTDLGEIKNIAEAKLPENDVFRAFVKNQDSKYVDSIVHELNNNISPQIDCTECGNCCKSLMVNVTPAEAERLSDHLCISLADMKAEFIEESEQGQLIMNTIPCHFLSGTRCSIYVHRFTECRDFPHLHKDSFSTRMFGLLIHYASCPIIFNVIEELKTRLNFFHKD